MNFLFLIILIANFTQFLQAIEETYNPAFYKDPAATLNEYFSKKSYIKPIHKKAFDQSFDNLSFSSFKNNDKLRNDIVDCARQLMDLGIAASSNEEWALKVFDSYGKETSGKYQGSTKYLGEYYQCIETNHLISNSQLKNMSYELKGKYCIVNGEKLGIPAVLGVCIPKICNASEVGNFLQTVLKLPFPIPDSIIECQESLKLDTDAKIALSIIGIIVALVLIGTIFDILLELYKYFDELFFNKPKSKFPIEDRLEYKILQSFSIYTNTVKLFTVNNTGGGDQLDCLNGIRFFSFGWVLLGHNWLFPLLFGNLDNPVTVYNWANRFTFMVVQLGAFFSVDSFFLMSGLLGAYLSIKEMQKIRSIVEWIKFMVLFYVHRLLRITPFYMLIIMTSVTLTPYIGEGPAYPQKNGFESPSCKKTWWRNFLYINNFESHSNSTDLNFNPEGDTCVGVSWYLANDMQFHIMSPIILIPLALSVKYKNMLYQVLGFTLAALFLMANIISTIVIILDNPGLELGRRAPPSAHQFNVLYITPWCRGGVFVIGIIYGYFIYLSKNKKTDSLDSQRIKILKWALNLFLLIVSLLFMGLMIFGLYPEYKNGFKGVFNETSKKWENLHFSKQVYVLYESFSRLIWGTCLGYIIYACSTSRGGLINTFLSLKIWVPFARLSFAAYLTHMITMSYFLSTLEHTMHWQNMNFAYFIVGSLFGAYVVAYFASMIFEVPITKLENLLFKRDSRKSKLVSDISNGKGLNLDDLKKNVRN